MKMLEGYPSMRKAMKRKLCDKVYDKYYAFMEENRVPITMHIANPEENWDPMSVSEYARSVGRYCDHTFPTKKELHEEVETIMKKFPRLRLALAHYGFLTYNLADAKHWLDAYENTVLDITPGGEQYFNMLKNWDEWHEFFVQYQDRIVYGTDFYAFPKDEKWEENYKRRTNFVRQFFETDTEHLYIDKTFTGVKIEKALRDKIYWENAVRELGTPKKIDLAYMQKTAESLLKKGEHKDKYAEQDLQFILRNL
jgi:predicted TIM-barrel fold metal-dependent hydrolase